MKSQACQPCAKRKVRCDREEPCSNCKRRKQDQCIYAEVSPNERIKQLEALVSSLDGDAEYTAPQDLEQAKRKAASFSARVKEPSNKVNGARLLQSGTNPMIVTENGQSVYLESSTWHSWNGKLFESDATVHSSDGYPRTPTVPSVSLAALHSIISRSPCTELPRRHPDQQAAILLWGTFSQRVHPLIKISFDWEIEQLRANVVVPSGPDGLSFPEHAFVFGVYLLSLTSLTEDECLTLLKRSKVDLLSDFQMSCEQALAGSNFLSASDITTLQACAMYILASLERLDNRGLWALMGVVIRNAERCGLHRDGSLLGLSPFETERRRRIWWQLQHLDIALSVKSGSMSLTLTAPWDTKLPLNIEDEDIDPHMRETPKEREGLTSMSHCLWTFWVLEEQRSFCRADGSRLGFSWAAEKSLSRGEKNALIDRLEAGLNRRFVQFCDPIRPRDTLIQIAARAFTNAMRRLTLHPLAYHGRLSELSVDHRDELLDVCMQGLEYDVLLHLNPLIKHFRWKFQGYFQWSALVYILVEARRQFDTARAERIWEVLSNVYAAHHGLSELHDDRRKSYAVELMIVAWRARERFLTERRQKMSRLPQKPAFLVGLESRISEFSQAGNSDGPSKRKLDEADISSPAPAKRLVPVAGMQDGDWSAETEAVTQADLDAIADFDFDAIDWAFWEAIQ